MNPFKASCEASTFETEQGGVCVVKVDSTPFEGAKTVREVFDALQFFFTNMEVFQTELTGKVSIRENEMADDNSMMQHRLVMSEESGTSHETNTVVFCDASGLDAERADDQCVIMTWDFVNRDDLYPYRPSERLRKDVSSAMQISSHRRRRPHAISAVAAEHDDGEVEGELVVVFAR